MLNCVGNRTTYAKEKIMDERTYNDVEILEELKWLRNVMFSRLKIKKKYVIWKLSVLKDLFYNLNYWYDKCRTIENFSLSNKHSNYVILLMSLPTAI